MTEEPQHTDKPRLKRSATLRRNRRTTVQGLVPGDTITTVFDAENWEWRLLIESANGVVIRHERLTPAPSPA